MTERKSGSWVLPLLIAFIILLPNIQFGQGWSWWVSMLAYVASVVFGAWGLINLGLYLAENVVWMWKDVQDAIFKNSPAGTAQSIRDLRPDQVQLLLRLSGGAWVVQLAKEEEQGPQYLLAGAEQVSIEFVKFVIEHSDENGLYPQNRFNDQAYTFDSVFRLHTDRDLYKAFQLWLSRNDMIEWPRGNQPARWQNGWTPEKLAKRLDLHAFSYAEPQARPLALEQMEEVMQQGSGRSAGI